MAQTSDETLAVARALWTIAPETCEIRKEPLPICGPYQARVRTLVSAISGGTESLVFAGKIPVSEFDRMRAPYQSGDFPFPVKYGYAAVGLIEEGPEDLVGRRVFALHPHQDRFVVPVAALTLLPEAVPAERCALAANLETALNAVWDAGVGPGDKIAIIGAGVVGALVAAIVSRLPAVDLTLVDIDPAKHATASTFGADFALLSDIAALPTDFDCIFHASGHGDGLAAGLEIAGVEARIIELSWYGSRAATLRLGGGFHSRRLQIVSSQVGRISASRRPRVDFARRMSVVTRLLDDARLDTLIGDQIAFEEAPVRFGDSLARRGGRAPLIRYSTGD